MTYHPAATWPPRGTWQWWLWHHKIRLTVLIVVLIWQALFWWPRLFPQTVTGDFRDPAVLSRALQSAIEKAGDGPVLSSDCVELQDFSYVCSVAFVGGNVATYDITVASDGSSWQAT